MRREVRTARTRPRPAVVARPRPVVKAYGARASYAETAYERARRLKQEATS